MTSGAIIKEHLPQSYTVKYLGNDEAHGLWGIKHTRKPVDSLVARAKRPGTRLPLVSLTVCPEGVRIESAAAATGQRSPSRTGERNSVLAGNRAVDIKKRDTSGGTKTSCPGDSGAWLPIDTISYGVQDLVYTRVFSIIVVQDCSDIKVTNNNIPFVCYAFVCDSRQIARNLTYTLANAFQQYSARIRTAKPATPSRQRSFLSMTRGGAGFDKQFAINLVSCEEYYGPDGVKDSEA